jgi:cytochrome c peroxidase
MNAFRAGMAMLLALGLSLPALAGSTPEPIVALPAGLNVPPARAELGRLLFNDVRLSANRAVSCASCHALAAKGGADGRKLSPGLHGELTAVNAPTVLNAAFNFRQFWDGRVGSLENQVEAVIQNPREMGSKWPAVVALVAADGKYHALFARAYPDGVTKPNIENAIASYERTLITPDSRFDRHLRGQARAINPTELAGYAKFKNFGCVSCHQGRNIGGNMFQKFGVMRDYFADRGRPAKSDLGRYLVTGNPEDKHVFKVPTLRNVALTAPYFHDGSAATLEDAVDIMFRYQLGRVPTPKDRAEIVAFLRTLTGTVRP